MVKAAKHVLYGVFITAAIYTFSGCSGNTEFRAANLTCDYAINPVGVDNHVPRLSWELRADGRGRSQSAYRIIVASSPELLDAGEGDVWDSGRVQSDRSIQVPYDGRPLRSRERCWWTVQVWDEAGRQGAVSSPAMWEMGLLEPADWGEAGWISAPVSNDRYPYEDTTTENGMNNRVEPAPMFRTTCTIDGEVRSARAYASGLGFHEFRLNGEKVGDHVLDPSLTPYDDRVLYVTHDITGLIKQGENALGAILGNGFYNMSIPAWGGYHSVEWRDRPAFICRIEIEYADGSRQTVVSDSTWKTTTGPILFDGVMNGETYDARLELAGWDAPGYDDSGWKEAIAVDGPAGRLVAQTIPAKVMDEVEPVNLTEPEPGVFIYDMGQNMAGWLRISVSGQAGTKITLRYGERLHDDGSIDRAENARGVSGRFQADEYILKGGGEEIWEPRFAYHGFQYVEVTGWPGEPALDNVVGRVCHTAFDEAGQFSCSNELLNRIHHATRWSYINNFMGNPTDCPQREKNGWTGDGHIAGETGLLNFRNAAGYAKWIDDFEGEQLANGQIPAQIPNGGGGYRIWEDYNHPEAGFGPAWNSSYVIVPWYLYLYCGDTRILERHWDGMTAWFEYVKSWSPGYICEIGLGDWVALDQETPIPLTSTGYYYLDSVLLSNIATVLGKEKEAPEYAALADSIRDAFNREYYDPDAALYSTGSQTAQSCALYQGLVSERETARVAAALADNVRGENGHLNVGLLGSKYLLTALTDNGYADLAYTVASQRDYPGWGWWIGQGATTLWEDWPGERSRNHIMFGEIDTWFYKTLAGIAPDPDDPGFHHIIIKPHPLGDLEWVDASHHSMYGDITSRWRRKAGVFTLDVSIPVNTSATVYVPASDAASVREGGIPAGEAEGVGFLRFENGVAVFTVGSGDYSFEAAR